MGLTKNTAPCWEATCDACGEGDNEDGQSYHYSSEAEMLKELEGYDWLVERNEAGAPKRLLCMDCADEERKSSP